MREPEKGFTFIVGNMFGSKTSEMITLLNLEQNVMGRKTQAFQISWDNRYSGDGKLKTHNGMEFPAIKVSSPLGIEALIEGNTEVIGIDEVQFFDERIIDFILRNQDKYLIIATALQMDFRGNPFPLRSKRGMEFDSDKHVGHLIPYAKVIPKYPKCTFDEDGKKCGEEAVYIQRRRENGELASYDDPTIVVGGKDRYAPRCIGHFVRPKK